MLTTTQAAELLGVNASRVRQLVIAGKLKATRIGPRMLVIDEAEIEAYRRTPPPQKGRPRTYTKTSRTC